MKLKLKGFTVVELLIVIVVIGVLASVSVVAYRGVQQRSRDTVRMSDIKLIDDAIQLYILANRRAPDFNGACPIQNNLDTTCYANDMTGPSAPSPYTWSQFRADIAPYITKLPVDPCGLKCYKDDGVAGHYGDKFFYYRYNAPAYLPGAGVMGSNPAPVATDYLIGAQSLETRSSFVIGFGSF